MKLRKLTHKSLIEFGLFKGRTVEKIMEHRDGKQYMIWMYFHASHINFNDELIKELKIEHIIDKPGKDPEIFDQFYYKQRSSHMDVRLTKMKRAGTYHIEYSKSYIRDKGRTRRAFYRN